MNLWLDDIRTPPEQGVWCWVKDYAQAISVLSKFRFEWMSFDHDLGAEHYFEHHLRSNGVAEEDLPPVTEKSGYDVALWMAEHEVWPSEGCRVHSFNPVGAKRICGVVDRYGPYTVRCVYKPASGVGKA